MATPPPARPGPGALVLDLLGDLSRSGVEQMRLKSLVALGAALGVPEPTMRVTLARFRERGWFEVLREGRESIYRLSPLAMTALHDGGRRIHRPEPAAWGGEWSMVIYSVPESDRQTRDELRRQLQWLGFGPLAPATWIRPLPRLDDVAAVTDGLSGVRLVLLTTRTSGLDEDRDLAAECWDVEGLAKGYADFVDALRERVPGYHAAVRRGTDAFVARIELVHSYRQFALRDPQLPLALQPDGWRGEEARQLFEEAHALLSTGSAAFYRQLDATGDL